MKVFNTDAAGNVIGLLEFSGEIDLTDSTYKAVGSLPTDLPFECYVFSNDTGLVALKDDWESIRDAIALEIPVSTPEAEVLLHTKLRQLSTNIDAAIAAPVEVNGVEWVGGSASLIQGGIQARQINGESTITLWSVHDTDHAMSLADATEVVKELSRIQQDLFQKKQEVGKLLRSVDLKSETAIDQLNVIDISA